MLLKFAIVGFLEDRHYKNASETTLLKYKMALGEFQQFCVEHEVVNAGEITVSLIKKYLRIVKT